VILILRDFINASILGNGDNAMLKAIWSGSVVHSRSTYISSDDQYIIIGVMFHRFLLPKPQRVLRSSFLHSIARRPMDPWIEDEESIDYYKGGFRPTVVGETIHHGRYEILRKLGH
jgi:hypothetical protein